MTQVRFVPFLLLLTLRFLAIFVELNYGLLENFGVEDWSEGNSDMASEDEFAAKEEEIVLKAETTMYDNLLKKLGSKSEAVANAFERRLCFNFWRSCLLLAGK